MALFSKKSQKARIEPRLNDAINIGNLSDVSLENIAQVYADELFRRILMSASNNIQEDDQDITYTLVNTYTPYRKGLLYWIIYAMRSKSRIMLKKTANTGGYYTFEQSNQGDALDENGNTKPDFVDLNFSKYDVYKRVQALFQIIADSLISTAKSAKIGGSVVAKIHALSEIVENDSTKAAIIEQLSSLHSTLIDGKMGYIDAKSELTTPDVQVTGQIETVKFAGEQISSLTGLSISFITGLVVGGLGNGDHGDSRRDDLAFKRYFDEILNPVLYSIYNQKFGYTMPIDLDNFIPLAGFIETTSALSEQEKQDYIRGQLGIEGSLSDGE